MKYDNLIVKKVILIAEPGPEPEPVIPTGNGTFMIVDATASKIFGIHSANLADGHDHVTVNWGDGNAETLTENIRDLKHTYADNGKYLVTLSDDIENFGVSNSDGSDYQTVFAPMVTALTIRSAILEKTVASGFNNAYNLKKLDLKEAALVYITTNTFAGCRALTNLDGLPASLERLFKNCFLQCAGLTGSVKFPNVTNFTGTAKTDSPFYGCNGLTEIHFAKAHEEEIKATAIYQASETLGTTRAKVLFDL